MKATARVSQVAGCTLFAFEGCKVGAPCMRAIGACVVAL